MPSLPIRFSLLAAIAVGSASAAELSSTPDRTFVTNGPVQAVVRAGDTIYLGGRFDRVGPRTGPGVELALDGSLNAGAPEISGAGPGATLGAGGSLTAVTSDGVGGWYIGGLFTRVGGVPRTNLAHVRADKSVDPNFNPVVNDGVRTLVLSGSTLYAAGLFTSVNGQTRNYIAALNAVDGSVTAFNPDANAVVQALAVSPDGSIIYAGGRFAVIGGQPRLAIAALNAADGSATLTFDPSPTQTPPQTAMVGALALSGSTLYVGGTFSTIGGQPRNNLAALNAGGLLDGTAVLTFNPNATRGSCANCGEVEALAVSGPTVYASGRFTNIGGQIRNFFAALNAADGTATSFDARSNGDPRTIVLSGSTIYVAGGFSSIGGQTRNYVAALNAADGSATAFNPNPNGLAVTLAASNSSVYLGGYFSSLGGVVRRSIAALNATDGTVTSFDPGASFGSGNATVYALGVSGGTVYVGGFFNSIGGQARKNLAALNAADGTATNWNPNANSTVETLAVSGSLVYAGGFFTSIGGQPRSSIAALNAADGVATSWNPGANGGVQALLVSGPVIYAGGYFTSIGGQTRNKIAALNVSDGNATSWDPDATSNANVLALAISDSTIYAGGNFTTIKGQPRKNIAGIKACDGTPTSFNPNASEGVYALAVSGPTVYAAGFFSTIGGETRNLLAGLDGITGNATSFDPNGAPGFGAFALAVASDGTLYAGGSFDTFELAYQQGFAQFSPIIKLTGAVSRKTHGSAGPFDISLPIAGTSGIECRRAAMNGSHQIVFTFATPVTVNGTPDRARITSGIGTVSNVTVNGNEVTVDLTQVANAQKIMLTLLSVSDGAKTDDVSVPINLLLGDTNEDGTVNSGDAQQTRNRSGQTTDGTNFRSDVNTDGTVNSGDAFVVRARSGQGINP